MNFKDLFPDHKMNAAQKAFLNNCTGADLSDQQSMTKRISELGSDPEVLKLEGSLAKCQRKEEAVLIIRCLLVKAGTDVDRNDDDPYGDGDQSEIMGAGERESQRQILRNLFAAGGDIEYQMRESGLNSFSWSCIMGDTNAVERKLKSASLQGRQALTELMEYRETAMRLPALILTVALSKHKQTVRHYTKREIADMDHAGVFRALIRYGARPDAKDVTGKTVCHYGAGVMATEETLDMAKVAIKATQTCAFLGHQVVLSGLNKTEYNGMRGTLGGFVLEQERRVMQPIDGSVVDHELSLKLENIFIDRVDDGDGAKNRVCILECSVGTRTNLIDIRDRIGSISIHEVAMSQRDDVAKFLCKQSTACLDVADGSGTSVRQMMCLINPIPSKVMAVLKRYAAKQSKTRCENCQKEGKKLLECSRCFAVVYCSKDCQVSHWKSKHKKDCKRLQSEGELELGEPKKLGVGECFLRLNSKASNGKYSYGPPDGVKDPGENFWIKVQSKGISEGISSALLIYDKSRTCNFLLPPGQNGHRELTEKVSQQQTFLGVKSYFKAKFNEKGRCVVYIHTSSALKW